ncbi:SusC/RagA family TonB-linked outer membrane protein [uncultured Tenacibaculum sp.]|uniref:SusC/RagA family TonB-linked outer membrane protein n=1 Tax=uncultured Tenacibaculum sp. TaxID=174713 RepID=UPI0026291D94|nr:SusC/RagA family TonB-linked outer membrane protein [uncultured Tenacibaculum sp.]
MKTKFNGILTLFLALIVHVSFAQDKTISGVVTDGSEPLPGVSVVKKGTRTGTETDFDGKYNIKAKAGDVLVFSFVGMKSIEKTVGSSSTINVVLAEDSSVLDEVIVTALGKTAKPRELSYSIQAVKAEDIENTGETNLVSALNSKAAGVQVITSSGSVGSSANIRIRGNTSINRSNSPLFIVDGVPIDNSSNGNGLAGVDNSNRAVDINQNDIESINILKGVAAQTLYGLRAANGVVIITTKKGKAGKPKITFSSNTMISNVSRLPNLQKEFAQGRPSGGVLTYRGPETREGFSWGPAISTLEFDGDASYPYDRNGRLVPAGTGNGQRANAYDNYNFFKTGLSTDYNLSISGGTEKSKYFFSAGKLDQTGVAPTEEFGRTSFTLNLNTELSDKVNVNIGGKYINSGGRRVQRGSNISGIMLGLLRTTPTFDNGNGLSGSQAAATNSVYQLPDGTQRSYRAGVYDNPFWTVAKNPSFDNVNRFIGQLEATYSVTDWLTLKGTYGFDRYTDARKSGIDLNSATVNEGLVLDTDISNQQIDNQFLALFTTKLNEDLTLDGTVGYNFFRTDFTSRSSQGNTLAIPGFFHISNTASQINTETINRRSVNALLADAKFGYKNMLFVNGAVRNDWSSTLPQDNNSFQSYSAGLSFVFSELIEESDWFDYGKLRGSWGSTGNDAPLYATVSYYNAALAGGDGFINGNQFPLFSNVAFERGAVLGNPNIQAETTTEYEIGAELKFLDSRISLDVTYYDKTTDDQVVFINQPATTGFTSRVINAGTVENKGWEVSAGFNPVRTEDFNWDINVNWTKYTNFVTDLPEGIEPILLNGFNSTSSRAVEGEQYGAIWGSRWLRDADGNVLIDDNGWAIEDPESGVVGDPNPDWTMAIRNTVSYKNFSLTALVDVKEGGDVWCGTCGILDYFGVSETTGNLRNETFVFEGVRQSDGQPNTTPVAYADPAGGLGANRWVRYGFGGISEDNVYDGSYIRLREVALTYSLGEKAISQLPIDSFSVTVSGRNLWLDTDYPGIDPETNLSGDSNGFGLDYFNQPNNKSYSLSLNISF